MKLYSMPAETAATTTDSIIEVTNLWRSYRTFLGREIHALKGVEFRVAAGEVTGLLGPNGAGKTTTLKTILGLLRPSRGSVRLFGRPVTERAARGRLGFLAEQPYFYDYLTAPEFLDLCGVLCGMSSADRRRKADDLLERVGLSASRHLRLRKYSKGMLQRLGLAQALIHEPSLVILDEPMSGLDPLGRSLVRDVMLSLKKDGTTILFSTHILPDVETLCDRVIVLANGAVAASGTVADLAAEADPEFEVVAQQVSESLLATIAGRGYVVRSAAGRSIVEAPDRQAMNRIVAEILGSGALLIGVSAKRSPLEARFLKAVASATAETTDSSPMDNAERTGTNA